MSEVEEIDDSVDTYALTPISTHPQYIRLLRVEAALHHGDQQDDTDPIRGTLLEVDLDTSPVYSALSYVWGSDSTKREVIIGDNIFSVTENCYTALWHLRRLLGQYTIWIDAICINQEDEAEKLAQISLMDMIYKQAEQVYAWLGPNDSFAATSVRLLANPAFRTQFDTSLSHSGGRYSKVMAWRVAFHLYFDRVRVHDSGWTHWNKREWMM